MLFYVFVCFRMFSYVFLCIPMFSYVISCFPMFFYVFLIYWFRNEVFIGLQFCWDGADMFEFSGKVIWPLAVSILNFPKDLRDKMNIGLHVVAMCTGNDMSLHIFAAELQELWTPGLVVNGITYRIGVVNGIWDGRGFESVTKTQGGGSLAGCNACHFPGLRFANTSVYPHYSSYLPENDNRRLKRPVNVPNHSLMYNIANNIVKPPIDRSYDEYIAAGQAFNHRKDKRILAVDGVKGIWALDALPYASHIWKTKDRMHCADHAVKDTINCLSKTTSFHKNRTEKYAVREACQEHGIFPFLYSQNKTLKAPWVVSHYVEVICFPMFSHVFQCYYMFSYVISCIPMFNCFCIMLR